MLIPNKKQLFHQQNEFIRKQLQDSLESTIAWGITFISPTQNQHPPYITFRGAIAA